MDLKIVEVDYSNIKHRADLSFLLNEYAKDPMGGGKALDEGLLNSLPDRLMDFPGAISFLAYLGDQAVGLANCFMGFSTFKAQPLINIHDFTILKKYRGKGISSHLFKQIERYALEKDCCKITLEVLNKNHVAMKAYQKFGFSAYELDPNAGQAIFLEKQI